MKRTQIYLTADQKAQLEAIARSRSVSMADVVRDAVSQYLAGSDRQCKLGQLTRTFGAIAEWKNRDGVELARELREGWSRLPGDGGEASSQRDARP